MHNLFVKIYLHLLAIEFETVLLMYVLYRQEINEATDFKAS